MPYTPAGPISIAVAAAATLLANVSYFQTWCGAGSAGAAAANIFQGEVGFPVAQVSIAGDVLTVTTRETHNLTVGQTITLDGASIGPQALNIAGQYTTTGVTGAAFTAAISAPDLAATSPQGALVIPSSKPIACITEEPGGGSLNSEIIGTGGACVFSGAIEILFENTIPSQYQNDPVNALTQARSELGQLAAGIAATAGTGDFMVLNKVDIAAGADFVASSEQADSTIRFERWRALVRCTWGLTS